MKTNTLTKRGFALIMVMVVIAVFSGSAYSIVTRFDNEVRNAVRNMDNVSAYYWQEGRLRLVRYKFGLELVRNGPDWAIANQRTTLQAIVDEVLPATSPTNSSQPFDWKQSLLMEDGGYVSKGTYKP